MEKPWLSAIVPSHNGNSWFAAALHSAVAQADSDIEVIVVDSSDDADSLEIARKFGTKLNLRVYRRPDLATWMAKTNFAVEQAKANWICMLHKDDLWLPNRCREVRGWIAAQPGAVMHLHAVEIIDKSGHRLGTWRCPLPGGDAPVPMDTLFERLLIQNFIAVPTPTIRRDEYIASGGIDETLWYTGDWDLYLKLSRSGAVFYHPQVLSCFRIHVGSLTMSGSRELDDFRRQMEIVRDRHVGGLGARAAETRRLATASIDVNVALAAASAGQTAKLLTSGLRLLGLGPRRLLRYFHYSRIIERAYPRLRAHFTAGL